MNQIKTEFQEIAESMRRYLLRRKIEYVESSDSRFLRFYWNTDDDEFIQIEVNKFKAIRLSVSGDVRLITFDINHIFNYILKLEKWNRLQRLP